MPAFLVGWTHEDPPPPGYLSAWFDQEYGGPLLVRFVSSTHSNEFKATHTTWSGTVNTAPLESHVKQFCEGLQWEHSRFAQVLPGGKGKGNRQDDILHLSRLARGLTLLTGGTAYDVDAGTYLNPSDWQDRDLTGFRVEDHVQVVQQEVAAKASLWLHTRGLTKFGVDELEAFHPLSLPAHPIEEALLKLSGQIIDLGKNLKIGEHVLIGERGPYAEVVRHRTDPLYGKPIAFRELRLL